MIAIFCRKQAVSVYRRPNYAARGMSMPRSASGGPNTLWLIDGTPEGARGAGTCVWRRCKLRNAWKPRLLRGAVKKLMRPSQRKEIPQSAVTEFRFYCARLYGLCRQWALYRYQPIAVGWESPNFRLPDPVDIQTAQLGFWSEFFVTTQCEGLRLKSQERISHLLWVGTEAVGQAEEASGQASQRRWQSLSRTTR